MNDWLNPAIIAKIVQKESGIATLCKLEDAASDKIKFGSELDGYQITTSMIGFIETQWGWNAVLQLLEDYTSFEKTLGISKEEFSRAWIEFAQQNITNIA